MVDKFELRLKNPLTQDDFYKITDAELEKTKRIWFTTPSGKQVGFIPESVVGDIKADIDQQTEMHEDGEFYIKNYDVKKIIDKHTSREDYDD